MNRAERLSAVLDLLAENGQVEVDADRRAARRLPRDRATRPRRARRSSSCSPAPVAVRSPIRSPTTCRSATRTSRIPTAKAAIARAASALVPRGAVIGLCGGTTATAIADALMSRADIMEPSPEPSLTVVTNAINIAMQLAMRPQIKTVVTGGVVHARSYELVGAYADTVLGSITLDLAFIGVNGVDAVVGPTSHDEREAAVNALMASRATHAVIVADASKIDKRAFAAIGAPAPVPDDHHGRRGHAASSASASPTAATTLSLPSEHPRDRHPLRPPRERPRHDRRRVGALRGRPRRRARHRRRLARRLPDRMPR